VASNVGKDSTFVANMIDLFKTNDLWFSEDLEGVDFGVELVIEGDMRGCGGTDKTDSGKGSLSKESATE
jgi:hypothetical protein